MLRSIWMVLDPEEMSRDEREWLNNYHKQVYEKIGPHLTEEEREWLKEYTKANLILKISH